MGFSAACAIKVKRPAVWNSLPPALHENMSLATFKTKLKTYLFTMTLEDHPALLRRFRDSGATIYITLNITLH